jgi:hypothetical protein
VIRMDDYYFVRPLEVNVKEKPGNSTLGSGSFSVRQATRPDWHTVNLLFDCDNRELKSGRTELGRVPNGKQLIVGNPGDICVLRPPSASDTKDTPVGDDAHISVESWQTLVRETKTVAAGHALQYNFPFVAGTSLLAQFQVQGGLNDKIQVMLLDIANYQLYVAHRPFTPVRGNSASIKGVGQYRFKVAQDGVYYLVLDNSGAWLAPRQVSLHLDAILPQSTPESEQMKAALENQYAALKRVFVFHDFQTSVRHCGTVNAFSNPNITICVEMLEELQSSGMTDAINFVYLHELGHSLMREWGLPLWDNEDAADEFATAFLLMGKQQKIALQAAQWWASQGATNQDAVAKIWMDDRHSLSPQRARNIIHWVNDANEIVPRWEHVFVPNMQTALLESLMRDPALPDKDFVKSELAHRSMPQ